MKKTLITLAALAASVASAATVDFTTLSGDSTVTLNTPQWANGGWDYNSGNTLTLSGATTVDSATKTISDAEATVTYTNGVYNLFRLHDSAETHDGPYIMSAGIINFGLNGSLNVTTQSGGLNLAEMGMKWNVVLDFVIETDDAALLEAGTAVLTRTIFTANGQGIWNREGNNAAFTLAVDSLQTDVEATKVDTLGTEAGNWKLTNPSENSVAIEYVVKYVAAAPAVPEPTTATLSLLALAGLAARRRRK